MLVAVLIAGTFGNPEKQPEQEKESLQFITSTPYSEPTPVTSKPATKSVVVTSKPTTKPAYPQTRYPQPLYRRNQYINKSYSKVEYCDPRSPPKCVKNVNETFCLKDTEYPEKEVQVNTTLNSYQKNNTELRSLIYYCSALNYSFKCTICSMLFSTTLCY